MSAAPYIDPARSTRSNGTAWCVLKAAFFACLVAVWTRSTGLRGPSAPFDVILWGGLLVVGAEFVRDFIRLGRATYVRRPSMTLASLLRFMALLYALRPPLFDLSNDGPGAWVEHLQLAALCVVFGVDLPWAFRALRDRDPDRLDAIPLVVAAASLVALGLRSFSRG